MNKGSSTLVSIGIALISLLLFLPGIGRVHLFDWDEINFAESAREMLVSSDYLNVQVNFENFWEKPPLFIWMQAWSMRVFGIGEFGARFPNVVAGMLTLAVLYSIGTRLRDPRFGFLWSCMYACSFLPFIYFKSGLIDPWFNLFIFLGIYFFIRYTDPDRPKRGGRGWEISLSAIYIGLATLTKGPVALLVFGLCFLVFWVVSGFRLKGFKPAHILQYIIVCALVGGSWFILQIMDGNMSMLQDFIDYQIRLFRTKDAGHGGFPMYHFVMILLGVFPASFFALGAFRRNLSSVCDDRNEMHFMRWMMITLWVVLILFSIVRTKMVHYSSLAYFPVTFMGAWFIYHLLDSSIHQVPRWMTALIVIEGVLVGLGTGAIVFVDRFKEKLYPYIKDDFAIGNLHASVDWQGWEWAIGLVLILSVILFALRIRRNPRRAVKTLILGSLVFIWLGTFFVTPQIERYSQGAAIEFYRALKGKDVYVIPNHKSYAHYFYSERTPELNNANWDYLTKGNVDKPTFFVVKVQGDDEENFRREAVEAEKLYDKNGFAFYMRRPCNR